MISGFSIIILQMFMSEISRMAILELKYLKEM